MARMESKTVAVWIQAFPGRNLALQWHDPLTGKRRTRTTGTTDEGEAEQQRADLEYELNHGLHFSPTKKSWTEFRQQFEQEYAGGLRTRSQEKFFTVFDVFEQEIGPTSLAKIDDRIVSQFAAKLRTRSVKSRRGKVLRKGLKPITIRNYLVCLKTALAWGVSQQMVPRLPEFPRIKVSKKKPQPIPAEVFEKLLLTEKDERWRAFLSLGWMAGLRLSEAYQLHWNETAEVPWIDFETDRIVLPAEFAKSDEDQWVPLHPQARAILEQLERTGPKVFTFISRKTGIPLTRAGVSNRIGSLAKKAGVRISMHGLRKGFGCRVASKLGKGNAPILHRLMRHSSMQITMDYYASVDDVLGEAILEI